MVFSLSPMWNELDVLEIRLAELDPVVDVFVIAEADVTYSGEEKPFHFEEQKERFEPWLDKIRYIKVEDLPMNDHMATPTMDLMPSETSRWERENFQRDALKRGLDDMADDDLVLLSDLDEIPSAECVREVTLERPVMRPRLSLEVMYLNWCWEKTLPVIARFCTGKTMKVAGPQVVRLDAGYAYGTPFPPGLGWHFSYLGGVEKMQEKISIAAHHEIDRPPYNQDFWLEECLESGKDLFGRSDKQAQSLPLKYLPQYVQDNPEKFKHLIGPEL